jgi:hypothetical protein
MTVLMVSIDPRPCAVEVLPRGTGEPGLQDARLLGMEHLLIFNQHVGKLPCADQQVCRLQHLQDLGLTHLPSIVHCQDPCSHLWPKLAVVACWKPSQIRPLLTGGVVFFFAELDVVAADREILHHHVHVSFEDRVSWQVLLVHCEHLDPIDLDLSLFAACLVRFGLPTLFFRGETRAWFVGSNLRLTLFSFEPIDLVTELLVCGGELGHLSRQVLHFIHQIQDHLA